MQGRASRDSSSACPFACLPRRSGLSMSRLNLRRASSAPCRQNAGRRKNQTAVAALEGRLSDPDL